MAKIPLTPKSGGGRCIAESALEPADIIVSTTSAGVSRIIRAATFSRVSHAMLYIGQGKVIEAIGEGVTMRPLATALAQATLGVAYRHHRVGRAQAVSIVNYARRHVGRGYDTTGAAGAGIRSNGAICVATGIVACVAAHAGAFNNRDRFFCSELVLDAFKRAGVPIISHAPGVSTPQDIVTAYSVGRLRYVGHVKA